MARVQRSGRYGILEGNRDVNRTRYALEIRGIDEKEPSYENCRRHKLNSQGQERNGDVEENDAPRGTPKDEDILSDTASEEDDTKSQDVKVTLKRKTSEPVAKPVGLAGLNRAQMELERLERAKRAGVLHEAIEPPIKRIKLENLTENQLVSASSSPSLQFPEGTIKWTHVAGFPDERYCITIEQVLQKETLKAAVLSGFQVTAYCIGIM